MDIKKDYCSRSSPKTKNLQIKLLRSLQHGPQKINQEGTS